MSRATELLLILLALLGLSSCSLGTTQWQLNSVVDGHTLSADRDGRLVEIQMCGIGQVQDEAGSYLIELLEQYDQVASIDEVARNGNQVVAEVFMRNAQGEILISEELLLAGLAQPDNLEDCPNQTSLALATQIAQEEGRGVWAED